MIDIQSKMNNALEEVYLWTQNNKLLLNTNKTKVMVIGSRQRIQKLNENNLNVHIRSTTIECVSHYKCLGVVVDSNLLFSKHVERVALQIKQKLGILRRLRGTFNTYKLSQYDILGIYSSSCSVLLHCLDK